MLCVGIYLSTFYVLGIETKNKFCKPEQGEDNSYNLSTGQSKFCFKLTFRFISIENHGKQKSKTP